MKKILFVVLLCVVSAGAAFGQKKVAILETIDREGNVPYAIELALRAGLTTGVTGTTGYEGYDRVDLSSVFGEQDFQRTGMVSDEQIHKLGEITGASYVLIAEAAMLDAGNIIITAKIVDVETAKVENSAMKSSSIEALELEETCNALAMKLLGVNGDAGKSGSVAVPRKPSGGKKERIRKEEVRSAPLHFVSSDGVDLYVGRNNAQNEELLEECRKKHMEIKQC